MGTIAKDMSGKTIGKWTVLSRGPAPAKAKTAYWWCKCVCGTKASRSGADLRRGNLWSCGCCTRTIKHGQSVGGKLSGVYKTWAAIIQRCNNPNYSIYYKYGGRGITVCERWKTFANFYADMGERPVGGSIERINNSGHYAPANCRWATNKEQARNRRSTVLVTYAGKTQSLAAWAEETGITYAALHIRLQVMGWSAKDALTTPTRISKRSRVHLTTPGKLR